MILIEIIIWFLPIYKDEDIALNARVFLWPKDMEVVLDLSMGRINVRREMVESVLKSKRVQFDLL